MAQRNLRNRKTFSTHQTNLNTLFDDIRDGNINLNPDYQRDVVWNNVLRTDLINSIMDGYYVPPVVLEENNETNIRECVDGKQRLTTLYDFFRNELKIKVNGYNKKKIYSELNKSEQKKYRNYKLPVTEISGYTDKEKRNQFQKIQNAQTMRGSEKMYARKDISLIKKIKDKFNNLDTLEKNLKIKNNRKGLFQVMVFCYGILDNTYIKQYNDKNITNFYDDDQLEIDDSKINFIYDKINQISNIMENREEVLKGSDLMHLLNILNNYRNKTTREILVKYLEFNKNNCNDDGWKIYKSRNSYKKDLTNRLKYFINNYNPNPGWF